MEYKAEGINHAKMVNIKALGGVVTLGVIAGITLIGAFSFFSFGVFGGNAYLGNSCLTNAYYICQNPVAYAGTNNIYVTLGQSTGINWVTTNVIFVNSSDNTTLFTPQNVTATLFTPQNVTAISGGLSSGEAVNVVLTTPNLPYPSGPPGFVCPTGDRGTVWAQYQTSIGGQFYYAQMASLYLMALSR